VALAPPAMVETVGEGTMLGRYRTLYYKWRSKLNFRLWPNRIMGYIRRMLGI